MRARGTCATTITLGSFLVLGASLLPQHAHATNSDTNATSSQASRSHTRTVHAKATIRQRHVARGGGLSCVPFARADSGIEVAGNAWQWWQNAAGVYARGSVPESGSVLAFRANGHMRLGHVAVVSQVVNSREIEIDHANWWGPGMHGGVARSIPVVDVSEANDWSAVRVGLGRSGDFGSVYPTYGFIYDRPDSGTLVASAQPAAPRPVLNPPPRDLRPAAERGWQTYEEVAQAPLDRVSATRPVADTVAQPAIAAPRKGLDFSAILDLFNFNKQSH
jgi:surface antigen